MSQKITFNCQGLYLEGRLDLVDPLRAAVVTHPHPLYGGDMDNPVVETIARAYRQRGWSTLKFNFRGTGESQGRYDDGRAEQDDVDAALVCLQAQGVERIDLAGYSFGTWVLARWSQTRGRGRRLRFVAPPVAFMDFSSISTIEGLSQVVVGGRDELAPPEQVSEQMRLWQPRAQLNIIAASDHFFSNYLDKLQELLEQGIDD